MKLNYSIALAVASAVLGIAQDQKDIVCPADPDDRFLANPDDFGSYYECSNGRPILQFCPDGLLFNPDLFECDYAELVPTCTVGSS